MREFNIVVEVYEDELGDDLVDDPLLLERLSELDHQIISVEAF